MEKRWVIDKQKLLQEILNMVDKKSFLTLKEVYALIDKQETTIIIDGKVAENKDLQEYA